MIISTIFLLGISAFLQAEKVATITEVLKPTAIIIDDDYMYVTEGTTIHIYNRKDYKYIKKFGNQGEGPTEFLQYVIVLPQKDELLINSQGKISFFTKMGKFKREIKARGGIFNFPFFPLKNGFVNMSFKVKENVVYEVINLYDMELKVKKEVFRMKSDRQGPSGRIEYPTRTLQCQVDKDRIFVAGEPGFLVRIFNDEGTQLHLIEKKDYEKRKFAEKDKEEFLSLLKKQRPAQFDVVKRMLRYKSHFPEIANILTDNNALFVITWKFEDGKFEIFQYDLDGKFVKKAYAPIKMSGPMQPYPLGIKNGILYQLIENEDEDWDLHITELIK
jgi:hypothetical protein